MYKFCDKLKRFISIISLVLMLMCGLSVAAYAQSDPAQEEQQYDFSQLLSEETARVLSDIGISGVNYDELLNASPRKIIDALIGLVSGELKAPVKTMGALIAIVSAAAIAASFHKRKSDGETVTELFFALLIVFAVAVPVSKALTAAASAIELNANFMLAYIPVFAGVVSISGMPITAASYSAATLGIAELTTQFCTQFITGLIGMILCFVFLSSVSQNVNSEKIIGLIKKTITVLLSLAATVFVGMITLKGTLAGASDSVAIKGVKLIAGNAIPIVGSAIGDAYTSVLGSLGLIKNTVGAFGIAAVAANHLPAILQLLLWYVVLTLCSVFCGMLGVSNAERILNGVASCVALMNTVVVFSGVVFILSTGVILSLKS